ncbi:two-component system, chemotaxis family, response regulator WspR [Candidatus Gastranaerophilus sp. (ex Termes propinquus)]|nr:two-component system, chemotaxis family, response regulator WspR [Candidatus Gastranaerophilus sp. (ex Termes propinquus)]
MKTREKTLTAFIYAAVAVLIFIGLAYVLNLAIFKNFFESVESKTFDVRQNILLPFKSHNENIVIIAVDDPSYEYITEKYGAWPAPRSLWADLIQGLEKSKPKLIVFDLLFVKRLTAGGNTVSDERLVNAIVSNDNVLVAMNLDDTPPEVRTPPELPSGLKNTVKNGELIKNSDEFNLPNCRKIMDEILNGTTNVGLINVRRDRDGVIRKFPPMLVYGDSYYKHLAFLVALKYLDADKQEFEIKNNALVINKERSIPLTKSGDAILNWYGGEKTFNTVGLYKVNEAIIKNDREFLDENFKDKIVYIGTTVTSLGDIKTSPVERTHPGVELHATFVNNVLDNSFIKRVDTAFDIFAAFILCLLAGVGVLRSKSVFFTIVQFFAIVFGYILLSLLLMHFFHLWIGIVLPLTLILVMFVGCYIAKYFFVYRDYEHTYKLATTDGLTDMYNHRYFQEQMIILTNNAKRYQVPYSLILIDIDFFKKFNDTHGHQSGDAVLRQVALTIKKSIRTTDIACRYGGEEMAVILPNTDKEEATIAAKKIWQAVEQGKFELATGEMTNVTISVGVASMPQDGNSPTELIEYADKCLYKAKGQGRNQVVNVA